MKKLTSLSIIGTAGLLLSACNAVMVEDRVGPGWSYYDGDLSYATNKGAIVTHVTGNPFGGLQPSFAATVRKMMYGQTDGAPVEFVATANDKTLAPFKVVLAFNAPLNVDGHDLCETGNKTASLPSGATLRASIAFCEGDGLKSDSYARVSGVSSIDDPKFQELVQQITRSMVPPDGSDDSGDDGNVP